MTHKRKQSKYAIGLVYIIDFFLQSYFYICKKNFQCYLFGKGICRGKVSIALAIDGGVCTSANGIHFPVGVVIVHHMEISMSTSVNLTNFSLHAVADPKLLAENHRTIICIL